MNKETISKKVLNKKKIYVGLDVHLKSYSVAILKDGAVIKKWSMPANPENLGKILLDKYGDHEICSAYEAGFSGFGLHRKLVERGINNIVVHAAAIAVSSRDKVKTDRRDAVKIAQQLSAGLLKSIRIPSIEEELNRQLSRTRQQLIKDRTRIMVQLRRKLCHFGYEQPRTGLLRNEWIEEVACKLGEDNPLGFSVKSLQRVWGSIEKEIKELNRKLLEQAKACPYEAVYRQVPGIGRISSRILANELGNMKQFQNEKALFSYVGLTPSEHSSGESIRRGHISRQGKPILRKILVEAAWSAIRRDTEIKRSYLRLSVRIGGKRAVVAIARKLIGRTRALFRKGESYRDISAA